MNWQEAFQDLKDGHDVYRDEWDTNEYLSPEFASSKAYLADPEAWPYSDDQEIPFKLRSWPSGDEYEPTDEDKAATDWQLV